jgi:hypothetical protein
VDAGLGCSYPLEAPVTPRMPGSVALGPAFLFEDIV